ncbi:twitching motility protein PilT [Pandoraea cepalis]|uniref:Twitching motility protein PilT n=1 Tax=Pandoraea cepalis TaxID=2508294 RepID=A0AAW7MGP0_9BURK|nr:ATPase, T2SS/T4P/T4SS family [Pandoraea cepalis]MDN4571879.1 twitching motility protein PilT [Pandoraea cepalis]MDN4581333.1 twitching motility protein PilT [Pandoraea cepalis]
MIEVSEAIPEVIGLRELTSDERQAIMMAKEGNSPEAPIEQQIRALFVWAIVTQCSDLHISGRGKRDTPDIFVNVRTPSGFKRFCFRYGSDSKMGRHWETKLFQLTGTSQGATTPDIASVRFEMELPAEFARLNGLRPFDGSDKYLVDVRVEYTKTFNGFKFTCRLLDAQRAPALHALGLSYSVLRVILRALDEPSGMVLVTGPTNSGKTTLLNAILVWLNDGTKAIHTIEDPVEIALRGDGPLTQVQVGGNITFKRALKSSLRQDPDAIMVQEIRDAETMEIALQAAQTGHLVFATVHTNNSFETYSRVVDLTEDKSRDAYRVASVLKLVIAQRLINRYDGPVVKRAVTRDEKFWAKTNGVELGDEIYEHGGEAAGKLGLVEVIVTTPEIAALVQAPVIDTSAIYRAACEQDQFEPLVVSGLRSVESRGARLRDCVKELAGNMEAEANPSLRVRLAKKYDLTFTQVNDAIDAYHKEADVGSTHALSHFLELAMSASSTV